MTGRLRYHPFCYQFFNQCLDFVALLFIGNLNQCLDYVDLLFSTNLYTKTLQNWNTIAYRVLNVNCHFISKFKLKMKNYSISYDTLRD